MLAVHSQLAPTPKYKSCLEPGYIFDKDGTIAERIHATVAGIDDGQPITFKIHLPAGSLDKRMSGLELAEIAMKYLPACLYQGIFRDSPLIERELGRIIMTFMTTPAKALDGILPWIQSVKYGVRRPTSTPWDIPVRDDDDVILMDFSIKHAPERTGSVFY